MTIRRGMTGHSPYSFTILELDSHDQCLVWWHFIRADSGECIPADQPATDADIQDVISCSDGGSITENLQWEPIAKMLPFIEQR